MAFERQNLARQASANTNPRASWLFSSADDDYAAISAADYFLDAIKEMKQGDWVMVVDSAGVHTLSYVATNDGTTIQLATGNTIAA